MALSGGTGMMESYRELEQDPESYYSVWERELTAAQKHNEKFVEISERILKRYRDERDDVLAGASQRLNLFWSNTQVLRSTLYTKPPKVDVSRLYRDYSDDVARVAGTILERLLNHDLEKDTADFDVAVRQAIDDWLIIGVGQVWYRYEVETEQVPAPADPVTGQLPVDPATGQPAMTERVKHEDALSDFVYWKDFLCSPARTWQEARWVGRRVNMTRDSLVDRFGKDIGKRVPLKTRQGVTGAREGSAAEDDPWATAEVWEIWCKTNRRVYWVCKGFAEFLDCRADPLGLESFFPCPEPMLANKTNNTLIPRADYSMARDQYQQVDVIVGRIHLLVDACKVRGAYDQESAPQLANILNGSDNKMVPVDNWALFGEKGGLKGVLDWVPIDMVVNVIQQLREEMAAQKQELYETLGIADIMRGATRATETATAQQIKAQFGSVRLQFKQFEVARFVRDAQRIKANIICGHYQPETMVERSNILKTPDAQHAQGAVQLLKDCGVMQYRLNIEPDSMAALDWAAERDARTQFLQAVGGFVQATIPLAQAKPESVPFLMQLLQWGLAGFKVGKEIEGVIDQAIQQMAQQPQGPSPEQQRQQAAEVAKTESEVEKNKAGAGKDQATMIKTLAEARAQKLQTASDQQIMSGMGASQPVMPGPKDNYVQ